MAQGTYSTSGVMRHPYASEAFDIVYSNSLLEHVGRVNQARVASEIRRVGKGYWVQVPCRSFPYEPHYCVPFFYALPLTWRRWLAKHWTALAKGSSFYLGEVDTIWPLRKRELLALFPDAQIWGERVLGLTKSIVAWRANP
jgi:hypothetical protein